MEFTLKLKEEVIDKLDQITESIEIIQERCKDYLSTLKETVKLVRQDITLQL